MADDEKVGGGISWSIQNWWWKKKRSAPRLEGKRKKEEEEVSQHRDRKINTFN